jgi:uncharacterized protein YcfL
MNTTPLLACLLVAALALAGCQSPTGPFPAQDSTKYTLEDTEMFVLMDQRVQHSVTSTGIQRGMTEDGRLRVVANIKNRENRRIQVQVSCVFKDVQGYSGGDETPWETLLLGESETRAVSFTAMNPTAERFTIRVREAR